jgi:hypothetical protein
MTKAKQPATFEPGDRISHNFFGEGFVKEITKSGNGRDIHIHCEFDEATQRSASLPATRFRKILSTYLKKLDWEDVIENDISVTEVALTGLEGSGMVQFDFSDDDTTDTYEPTAEEELAASDENDDILEELDV